MSAFARLLNLFAIPGDVFDDVRISPPAAINWVLPALLFVAVGWVSAWLIFSQESIQQQLRETNDRFIQKLVDKGALTEQQAEQSRARGDLSTKISPYIVPVFGGFVTPFGWGFLLWMIGTKVFKSSFPFMKAVEVAGLANAISVLETVVKTLLIVGLGNLFASPSPALLLKDFDPQKPSHSLLAVANVMTFWVLAVRAIGLSRLSGVHFARAGFWVFGLWALYTTFLLGIGLAVRAAFGL